MNFAINIENWRLVSGYDNYEVSSHGRVRNNTNGYIMKQTILNTGYIRTWLTKDGERKHHMVHRLIAFAFLDRNDEHTEVDHLDHNKSNNMVSNLRWVTTSVNQRNASRRTDNTSGASGVSFHKGHNSWGARWYNADMRRQSKHFRVAEYGNDEAKQMAINYRRERCLENGYINV